MQPLLLSRPSWLPFRPSSGMWMLFSVVSRAACLAVLPVPSLLSQLSQQKPPLWLRSQLKHLQAQIMLLCLRHPHQRPQAVVAKSLLPLLGMLWLWRRCLLFLLSSARSLLCLLSLYLPGISLAAHSTLWSLVGRGITATSFPQHQLQQT